MGDSAEFSEPEPTRAEPAVERTTQATVGTASFLGRVPSVASVIALQRAAGNRATGAVLRSAALAGTRQLQRIGYPLGKPLPAGAEKPLHGETPDRRQYSRQQFETLWTADVHSITPDERQNIKRGCIGITNAFLGLTPGQDPPLDECYSSFAKARESAAWKNTWSPSDPFAGTEFAATPEYWIVFGMLFWSNRDLDDEARKKPEPLAFRPDASGKVDMSAMQGTMDLARVGFKNEDHVNYDFGLWDEATQSIWHANHGESARFKTPVMVYQSTRDKFAHKVYENGQERWSYVDFDRCVWCVAKTTVRPQKVIA